MIIGSVFAYFQLNKTYYLEYTEMGDVDYKVYIQDGEFKDKYYPEEYLKDKAYLAVKKPTFGSTDLPFLMQSMVGEDAFDITLIGLCTDICVVSNALLLKAHFPEVSISVVADCCAGVTPEKHEAALEVMRSCQIEVI